MLKHHGPCSFHVGLAEDWADVGLSHAISVAHVITMLRWHVHFSHTTRVFAVNGNICATIEDLCDGRSCKFNLTTSAGTKKVPCCIFGAVPLGRRLTSGEDHGCMKILIINLVMMMLPRVFMMILPRVRSIIQQR